MLGLCCGPRASLGEGNGTHSSTLAWKIPWTEEPGRLQSMGVAKSRTRLSNLTFTFYFHALEKEMATHSSVLPWRIPGTREPGGLQSMGSHRVGHDWSNLAAAGKNSKNYLEKASNFTWKPWVTSSSLHCMKLGVLVYKTWALVNSKGGSLSSEEQSCQY